MRRTKEQTSFDRAFHDIIGSLSLAEHIFPIIYRRIFDAHAMLLDLHMHSQDVHSFLYEAKKRGYIALLPNEVVSPVRKKLVWIQRGRFLSNKTSFVLNNLYVLTKKGGEKFAELCAKNMKDPKWKEEVYRETISKMDKVMLSVDTLRSDPALLVREYAISNLISAWNNAENPWQIMPGQSNVKEYVKGPHVDISSIKLPDFLIKKPEHNTSIAVYIITGYEDVEAVKRSVHILNQHGNTAMWILSYDSLLELRDEFKYIFELDKDARVKVNYIDDHIRGSLAVEYLMWLLKKAI